MPTRCRGHACGVTVFHQPPLLKGPWLDSGWRRGVELDAAQRRTRTPVPSQQRRIRNGSPRFCRPSGASGKPVTRTRGAPLVRPTGLPDRAPLADAGHVRDHSAERATRIESEWLRLLYSQSISGQEPLSERPPGLPSSVSVRASCRWSGSLPRRLRIRPATHGRPSPQAGHRAACSRARKVSPAAIAR
jgi:hypothetical protein